MFKLFLFFFFFSFNSSRSHAQFELVVWNVGQGSWATEVHPDICLHFDMGGEKDVSTQALRLCQNKENFLILSHWDWDHISFVGRFAGAVKKICLVQKPQGPTSSYKQKLLKKVPLCSLHKKNSIQKLAHLLFRPWKARNSNDRSDVFRSRLFQVLFPGDSSKSQEKYWLDLIPSQTRGLILGHHGSSTSTSKALLNQMPRLQWAVASARSERYGHPHWKVVDLLKKEKVPLLKTEDWGHLHFSKISN